MLDQAVTFIRHALAPALVAGMLLPSAASAASPSVPVRIGGDVVQPACFEYGELIAENGDDTGVNILSGPTGSFRPIDRLPVGSVVLRCDVNGTYVGVIYGEGDCGVGEVLPRRTAYRGLCSSGWVHNRAVLPVDAPNV